MTGERNKTVRVKTARRRSTSSARWLQRQLNDPYVVKAKKDGYRSRAAYKLLELDEKFKLLKPGLRVVDLGYAPGGWTQVILAKLNGKGSVVGIDVLPAPLIDGATLFEGDFTDLAMQAKVKEATGGLVDLVLSDMAPNTTGHTKTDHIRIMNLVEEAYAFALEMLAEGGGFVAKVWQGGTETALLNEIKRHFSSVKHAKPKSSRADSAETFLVATGFSRFPR